MNESDRGVLRVFAAVEILSLLLATGLVTGSLLGATDVLTEFSRVRQSTWWMRAGRVVI